MDKRLLIPYPAGILHHLQLKQVPVRNIHLLSLNNKKTYLISTDKSYVHLIRISDKLKHLMKNHTFEKWFSIGKN